MRRRWLITAIVCAAVLLTASLLTDFWSKKPKTDVIKVGFVYSEDESTPYTANFMRAQYALEEEFGDKVEIYSRSNVLSRDAERPIHELIQEGCSILFINLDTDIPVTMAREYPDVIFCHISMPNIGMDGTTENYHTFNSEIYQARYVSGIAAGMKLQEMLDSGEIEPEQALVGYVGANSSTEVISGCNAFMLGVLDVVPEARMLIRYTGSWGNYNEEKKQTKILIDKGCVIIAQHVNTSAPAVACKEATAAGKKVYHVGYHQSLLDIAPSCALISIRTNWIPYVTGAVQATLDGKKIEDAVPGSVHERDMNSGFENGWVELLDLNPRIAAPGTQERMDEAIERLREGKLNVFSGPYTAVNPLNGADTIDLAEDGYTENEYSSNPSFGYILKGYITVDN